MVSVRRRMQANRARREQNQMGAFAVLPRELILCVLTAVSASADKPADIFNTMLVCKEFGRLLLYPAVLQAASAASMSVRPRQWCTAAERFLRFFADSGNADANFFLGMVHFYCFGLESQGWSRMMMALRSGHAHATFALAVLYYNGSFSFAAAGFDSGRYPRIAARLLGLAACRGHAGALRDLAFCVANGFGVRRDAAAARRLAFTANLREFRARYPTAEPEVAAAFYVHCLRSPGCLTSELGCFATVPAAGWAHPANRFLCEWFATHPLPLPAAAARGLPLLCSFPACGRPETRGLEYRRCRVCGVARYCSRTCQSLHWRTGHTRECVVPAHHWLMQAIANAIQQAAAAVPAPVNNATDDDNDLGGGGGGAGRADAPPAPPS